MGTTVNTG